MVDEGVLAVTSDVPAVNGGNPTDMVDLHTVKTEGSLGGELELTSGCRTSV